MSEKTPTNKAVVAQIAKVWETAKVAGLAMKTLPNDFPTDCVRDVLVELQGEVHKLLHATHVTPIPADIEKALTYYAMGSDPQTALHAKKVLSHWVEEVENPFPGQYKDNLTEAFQDLITGPLAAGTLKVNPSAHAVPVLTLNHWWVTVMMPTMKQWQDRLTEYEALKEWLRDNDILTPEAEGSFEFAMKKLSGDKGVDIIAELDDILVPANAIQAQSAGLPNIQVFRWETDPSVGKKGRVAINIAKRFKDLWIPNDQAPPVFKYGSPFVSKYMQQSVKTGKLVYTYVQFNAIPGYKPEQKLDVTDLIVNTFGSTHQSWSMKANGVMVEHTPSGTIAMCDAFPNAPHENKALAFETLQIALEEVYGIT